MAPRVFLLCILSSVGLLIVRIAGAELVAQRRKPAVLACDLASGENLTVERWLFNGKALALRNNVETANGTLIFHKVSTRTKGENEGDQGEYRCVVRSDKGALVSGPLHLRVAGIEKEFSENPQNISVGVQSTVRFTCQIDSVPVAHISWERNKESLPPNNRYLTPSPGVLYILETEPSDSGHYRCKATNLVASRHKFSNEALLNVSSYLGIENVPELLPFRTGKVVQVLEGNDVLVDCAATGSPPPKLGWSFNIGGKIVPIVNMTSSVALLRLQNVTVELNGTYICSSEDKKLSQSVVIEVWQKPNVSITPLEQKFPTAKTVRFTCEASGIPKPELLWFKDGELLHINGRIKQKGPELVLTNTISSDSGLYQCIARNKAGESWAVGRLEVKSRFPPDPPTSVTCQTLSSTQVQIKWDDPNMPDTMTAYTVHSLPTDGGEEKHDVSINKTFVVEKLLAYTNYTFYVRSYSQTSASDQSVRVICQTEEAAPVSAPVVRIVGTSPTSVHISWIPLPNEKARGSIVAYKVQWRSHGHATANVEEVAADVLDYTIIGLHPGRSYDVRVLAATLKGYPDLPDDQLPWKIVENPSNFTEVPVVPIVHLNVVNSTSIEVSWTLPHEKKFKSNGFKVFYRKQNGQKTGPILVDGNSSSFLLGDLEPDTGYEVHVSVDGGVGVASIHTLGGNQLLQPPGNLQADPISASIINMTWTVPVGAKNISYYSVSYAPVSNVSLSKSINSSTLGVQITGLKAYTRYELKVRTHDSSNRHGPYSQLLECRTREDLPGKVRDLAWEPANTNHIRISWREPASINGILLHYVIAYSYDMSLPLEKWNIRKVPANRTNIEVQGLVANKNYSLLVRAENGAGQGEPASAVFKILDVTMPEESDGSTLVPPNDDQHLGILVGVAIGVGCIIICTIIILWRRKCLKMSSTPPRSVNGNSCQRQWELEVMESETFMESHIPPVPSQAHFDTKGGYPNGHSNGMKLSLLSNGRIPNGHASHYSERNSVHITENPQFKCGETEQSLTLEELASDQQVPLLEDSAIRNINEEDSTVMDESSFVSRCLDSTKQTVLDVSHQALSSAQNTDCASNSTTGKSSLPPH